MIIGTSVIPKIGAVVKISWLKGSLVANYGGFVANLLAESPDDFFESALLIVLGALDSHVGFVVLRK